mmetsp:Transcript_56231/g.182500  ORF Transcript_56231/g.182500 Transcript_56231/m.182500 type:complete len:324 (-) Transcript_56231:1832-2803(-)
MCCCLPRAPSSAQQQAWARLGRASATSRVSPGAGPSRSGATCASPWSSAPTARCSSKRRRSDGSTSSAPTWRHRAPSNRGLRGTSASPTRRRTAPRRIPPRSSAPWRGSRCCTTRPSARRARARAEAGAASLGRRAASSVGGASRGPSMSAWRPRMSCKSGAGPRSPHPPRRTRCLRGGSRRSRRCMRSKSSGAMAGSGRTWGECRMCTSVTDFKPQRASRHSAPCWWTACRSPTSGRISTAVVPLGASMRHDCVAPASSRTRTCSPFWRILSGTSGGSSASRRFGGSWPRASRPCGRGTRWAHMSPEQRAPACWTTPTSSGC